MSPIWTAVILGGGPIWPAVVAVVLGGGLAGSVVALVKLKPEGDQILISSAKDVVLIQKGALDDQRRQMRELREQMDSLETRMSGQLASARREREEAVAALAQEVERNDLLTARVAALEAEIAQLRTGVGPG